MNGHPQFEEDFGLYALGALEGDEKQSLESHLTACQECARKIEEARGRVAVLALAAPPLDPPARAREHVLRQIRTEPHRGRPQLTPQPGFFRRWLTPSLALASIVLAMLAGILALQNRRMSRSLSELRSALQQQEEKTARAQAVLEVLTARDTLKVTLVSGQARPLPRGNAFYNSHQGLLFYAFDLPPLPSGRTYQLWLVPTQGAPISAGIFQPDAQGHGTVLLPPLPPGTPAKAFAVTVEPAGGVPQPTGEKVLVGLVS